MFMRPSLLCGLLLVCASALPAQDPVLSQFFANRSYLNPAFTGIEQGLQLTTTARNQWLAADRGYRFYTAAVEWQEPCLYSGFGFMLTHADEGLAPISTTSGRLTFSYAAYRGQRANLHGGFQIALTQKSLNWDKLTFSDELDPVFGVIYPSAVTLAGRQSVRVADASAGVLFRFDSRVQAARSHRFDMRSHLGMVVHHWASLSDNTDNESFLGDYAAVPVRLTLHGGTIIPLEFLRGVGNKVVLSPNFRLESQGPNPVAFGRSLTLLSGGLYAVFLNQFTAGALLNRRSPLPGGRHTNSTTLALGFSSLPQATMGAAKKDIFYIGLSVDVNTSGLGVKSNNAYELNFRYNFRQAKTLCDIKKRKPTRAGRGKVMDCPHNFAY